MAPKLNKKIIINVTGVVIVLALAAAGYLFYAGPRLKEWRDSVGEIKKRQGRLKELRKLFNEQDDPNVELMVLSREIKNLKKANKDLEKIKRPGIEVKDLPRELNDPDPAIKIELYRDYMKEVMETTENSMKDQLRNAKVSPPDIKLYDNLKTPAEAAYYMNRAGGLKGIVNAMERTQAGGSNIVFDKLALDNYKKGSKGRRGAINVLSYALKMTMDVESLMSFVYHLQEEEGYYYIEQLDVKPGRTMRGAKRPLDIGLKVNTLLVFKSQAASQVKKAAAKTAKTRRVKKGGGRRMGGLLGLAAGMKRTVREEKKAAGQKKWYQFWK